WHAARARWPGRAGVLTLAALPFAVIDLLLVAGCSVKLFDGGWFPLGLGMLLFILMSTWSWGRARLLQTEREQGIALGDFLQTA
ncbi:KUP/HAK/KT family potassium transporter, partial [Bacillus cereus group sp. Bce036]